MLDIRPQRLQHMFSGRTRVTEEIIKTLAQALTEHIIESPNVPHELEDHLLDYVENLLEKFNEH